MRAKSILAGAMFGAGLLMGCGVEVTPDEQAKAKAEAQAVIQAAAQGLSTVKVTVDTDGSGARCYWCECDNPKEQCFCEEACTDDP